ncbi:MAG: deoxyribodipyrimidine photolyase, partial [Burkholderiaceae bacterium]
MVETGFPPTDQAWQSRLADLNPQVYAKTRNHLQGAVSRISPYLTHGFLGLQDAVAGVRRHSRLEATDKLFAEFAWRSFFRHVWDWAGDSILKDMRPGLPDVRYRSELPADIREGRTGLAVIDQAVA